jgi:signal transduction histidine kinase
MMSTSKIHGLGAASSPALGPLSGDDHSGHSVQFYAEDSYLLDDVSRFIGTALGAGDAALVIATKVHREGLEYRLQSRGLDTLKAALRGRFIVRDAASTLEQFMVEGFPDAARFAKVIGPLLLAARQTIEQGSRVVAFGEMVALLWQDGKYEAAIRTEQLWNELSKEYSFFLHCAYPISGFAHENLAAPFLKICSEHSQVIPSDRYTALQSQEERRRNIAVLQQKEQAHDALRETKIRLEDEINERIVAERKLRASECSLRELSGRLLKMQDDERRHLGRELHDSVGQYLAVLKMRLEGLKADKSLADSAEERQFAECMRLVDQSIVEVRTMSYLLYPPMLEEMGLEMAISWYLEGFTKRSGVQAKFEMPAVVGRVHRDAELAIFRILQESLTNIHRHSESPTAQVRLSKTSGELQIEISDQGKGFPAPVLEPVKDLSGTIGVGLRGMTERVRQLGGKLEVLSTSAGTTVRAAVPCA